MTRNELVMACSGFAREHGTEELLDALAGIHRAYTETTPVDSPERLAYEMAGVDLSKDPTPSIQ